jgi:hypothetical protein
VDIQDKTIWQVAAGDTDRNFVDLCLKWDVILNGPGSEGQWPECRDALRDEWELSGHKLSDLRRFCEDIKEGHLIVLRLGTAAIYGVGIVDGQYLWHPEFGDIDGWDLQHVRRVRWLWKYDREPQQFDTYTLKLGSTTQQLESPAVRKWLASLAIDEGAYARPIAELPAPTGEARIDEISEYLFDHGVANNAIEMLIAEIGELVRIAKWYQKTGSPSESETIAYLVLPLLRALGWTPQKMAVEWQSVDVVLFHSLPRSDENIAAVVEAKSKDRSCLSAKSQAQYYAEQAKRDTCQRLIVTDGLRYGVYVKENGVFPESPLAYLNLTDMRASYPILECQGALEAFLLMSADWKRA